MSRKNWSISWYLINLFKKMYIQCNLFVSLYIKFHLSKFEIDFNLKYVNLMRCFKQMVATVFYSTLIMYLRDLIFIEVVTFSEHLSM